MVCGLDDELYPNCTAVSRCPKVSREFREGWLAGEAIMFIGAAMAVIGNISP